MKTLVVYASQTGFTKKYAEWISTRLNADVLTIQEAKKKKMDFYDKYGAIIYGGWGLAGSVVGSKWFLEKATAWKDKKLTIFCVGASPEENPDVEVSLNKLLTDEQRTYIKGFYCQGGIDYSRMNMPSKLAMKALVSALSKKKDASQKEKDMAEMISHSYDISDEKYIDPIVQYIEGSL
ncbi:MAG: flavodoxin domain-containing protein [Clostridia bacterium]|nr:flavodoxin domain-containing protein [Clostridia bacterium]